MQSFGIMVPKMKVVDLAAFLKSFGTLDAIYAKIMAGWAVGGVGRDIDSLWRDQPNFLAERLFTISLKENNHQSYRTYFFFFK